MYEFFKIYLDDIADALKYCIKPNKFSSSVIDSSSEVFLKEISNVINSSSTRTTKYGVFYDERDRSKRFEFSFNDYPQKFMSKIYYTCDKTHTPYYSLDYPAYIEYYFSQNILSLGYYRYGKFHRVNGPACIKYNFSTNSIVKFSYYIDGYHYPSKLDGSNHNLINSEIDLWAENNNINIMTHQLSKEESVLLNLMLASVNSNNYNA